MSTGEIHAGAIARVNGIPLQDADDRLSVEELRQRACDELLRQAAQAAGLLADSDRSTADGVLGEAAVDAIESLLDSRLHVPEPSEDECRRYHAAHRAAFQRGERALLRHILFAITPGVDIAALRERAQATLLDLRAPAAGDGDTFAAAARRLSNCPSGADDGRLGWRQAEDCAPEFAQAIFGHGDVGVLPRLVHSRFGLHIVEVQQRQAGEAQDFAAVRGAVTVALRRQSHVNALRRYLHALATAAVVEGVDLALDTSPR
ncbi:MAG TPA: peptidylprolyl isomerase [Accumulibacter sp.]|nr:peptidylprolyl isomerase [Accumulibacter sp.]